MSWLSVAWRSIKKQTGKTDLELAFTAVAMQLNVKEKAAFLRGLQSVQYVLEVGSWVAGDATRLDEAKRWCKRALDIVGQ